MPVTPRRHFMGKALTAQGLRTCVLAAACLLVTACSGPASFYDRRPSSSLRWPPSPYIARVRWVATIADYQKQGYSQGFWSSVLKYITGQQQVRIIKPRGVLFDSSERLFIADPGASVVHEIDIKNKRSVVIHNNEGDAVLRMPIALAEDDNGHLYISDSKTQTVYRYDIMQQKLTPFFSKGLKRPTGMAYNRLNKLLYIADTIAGQIVAVDGEGVERIRFGSEGAKTIQFNRPVDLWADTKGQVYVTDSLNFSIKIFTPEGRLVGSFGNAGDSEGDFNKPKGVAVDSLGNIYVCDSLQDSVQIFDSTGRLLMTMGNRGTADGEFWMPSGIYIDQHDFIYVADTFNQRVQIFRFISRPGSDPDDTYENNEDRQGE